jgi:UDP-glucose 4-epimerase
MRVLVTGGCGFIGSHVVDALVSAGHTPRILDLRRSPYHADVEVRVGDLLDFAFVRDAMAGCDAVIHLAAAADVDDVVRSPMSAEAVNGTGTVNVLEAARQAGVARVVYASTIWVYGDADGVVDETSPVPVPRHLYTATKLAGEHYCSAYAELYGVSCTVLRFGIPYGPRARPAGVIPIFVRKALDGEPLTIAGSGLQSRRFVYVADLADGVVRALRPEASGRTYNLAGDESVTVRDIAEHLRRIADVEIVSVPGRAADFSGAEVSAQRAAHELDWRARTRFEDGLAAYIDWYRETSHAPDRPPNRHTALSRALARLASPALVALALLGSLLAYLGAVHAIGVTGADERTVAILSAAVVVGFGVAGRHDAARALSLLSACALVLVFVPTLRHHADLGSPDAALVLLSLAGGSLSLTLARAAIAWRGSHVPGRARTA